MTDATRRLIRAAVRLKRHCEHAPGCSFRRLDSDACDCGLGAVLAELQKAIRECEKEKSRA